MIRKFSRHFLKWMGWLVGIPLLSIICLALLPGLLAALAILPFQLLSVPPSLLWGAPHFTRNEFGIFPESGAAWGLMLAFWTCVCLLLASITALFTSSKPEAETTASDLSPTPFDLPPTPTVRETRVSRPIRKDAPPPVEVIICPACRATNAVAAACFRCGAQIS